MSLPSASNLIVGSALAVVAVSMWLEDRRSRRHDRLLRARGAVEPGNDVYRVMQVVYPSAFVAMAVEGGVGRVAMSAWLMAGAALWCTAKALKYWALATLGHRWTFRVLVPPDGTCVSDGPYRWMRHPNYVAVLGEIAGMAVMMQAPVSGTVAFVWFAALLRRRIAVENRALGL